MRKVKTLVERVLAQDREARSNNNRLVLLAWREAGFPVPDELLDAAPLLPQVESIRRQRARIQNVEGRLRP